MTKNQLKNLLEKLESRHEISKTLFVLVNLVQNNSSATAGDETLKQLELQNIDDIKFKIEGRQYFYQTIFYQRMSVKKKNKP